MNLYDFTIADRDGTDVSLSGCRGKVVLVVNTATECGFTPTYADLQALYERLHGRGLEIIDLPCDQFGHQAPGSADEIHQFCTGRFGVTFPQFGKVEVNGAGEIPLYTWLKSEKGFAGFDPDHKITPVLVDILGKDDPDWQSDPSIKWNFTKFLVDREGDVVTRFEPTADVEKVVGPAAEALL
jgi:glutathione peroxidase